MCNSKAEGGQRCDNAAHQHVEHPPEWWEAKRERRRATYRAKHPNVTTFGAKRLAADAGAPKRRPGKLTLGSDEMIVDMSPGLTGQVPEGHPEAADLEAHNATVAASAAAVAAAPEVQAPAAHPTLTGSYMMVERAGLIREKAFAGLAEYTATQAAVVWPAHRAASEAAWQTRENALSRMALEHETDAAWWIQTQGSDWSTLVQALAEPGDEVAYDGSLSATPAAATVVAEPVQAEPVQVDQDLYAPVRAAEAEHEAALEGFRAVAGSNPNMDRRAAWERKKFPMPNADYPDGRNWKATQSKAQLRLTVAKRVRAEAEAAWQAAMKPGWDKADAALYAKATQG